MFFLHVSEFNYQFSCPEPEHYPVWHLFKGTLGSGQPVYHEDLPQYPRSQLYYYKREHGGQLATHFPFELYCALPIFGSKQSLGPELSLVENNLMKNTKFMIVSCCSHVQDDEILLNSNRMFSSANCIILPPFLVGVLQNFKKAKLQFDQRLVKLYACLQCIKVI